jgi:hypothetical protein
MSAFPRCHAESREAERNGVDESRRGTFQVAQRDASAALRITGDPLAVCELTP